MRKRLNFSEETHQVKVLMRQKRLHTVCEEARCPNLFECWSKPTATFMILGDVCIDQRSPAARLGGRQWTQGGVR